MDKHEFISYIEQTARNAFHGYKIRLKNGKTLLGNVFYNPDRDKWQNGFTYGIELVPEEYFAEEEVESIELLDIKEVKDKLAEIK